MDATSIVYTGTPLTYISVTNGMNLKNILININTAINSMSPAPDYSGYNLYCVKETDGVTHPTNTQNFAEGISKNLCDFHTAYNTFTGTTYTNAISTLTTAVTGLQSPALTYAAFSITNTDTVTQVWNKSFTGFTAIINSILPTSANWSSLGLSNQTTTVAAFNAIIAYELTQDALIAGKQATIATFNNTGNCLAGGATDSIFTTVGELITYTCALPTLNLSGFTWGAVSTGTTLTNSLQNTVSALSSLYTNAVVAQGTGLTIASVGTTYQGKVLALDTTYTQLYKVMVTGDAYTNANVLDQKIESADSSITLNVTGNKLNFQVTTPVDHKVKVNASDTTADYLGVKLISGTSSTWGISIQPIVSLDNSSIQFIPSLNPEIFIPAYLNYISTNPTLLSQNCALIAQCGGGSCGAVSDLNVVLGGGQFALLWTAVGGTTTSQLAKYRATGDSTWITINFNPANPLSDVATTTATVGLDVNVPYQFQIDSICPGGIGNSNIYESVIYDCASVDTAVNTGVISITQNPLPGINTIQYRLKNGGGTVVNSQTATGLNPQATFTSQSAGTYSAEWRYGTTINGVTLYSDDASQLGNWCSEPGIVIS